MSLKNIKAIIIEDEEVHLLAINDLIQFNFPEIQITGSASTVEESINLIRKNNFDLIFMDVNLPDGTAFDILNRVDYTNFEIIFITSHNEFAVNAFEFAALHYLIKPITIDKIHLALERYYKYQTKDNFEQKIQILNENLTASPQNILLPTINGHIMLRINDIIRLEAGSSYTVVYIKNKIELISSKNLRKFESLLLPMQFFRVHNSHIININHITKLNKGKIYSLEMSDKTEIPISNSKRDDFISTLNNFAWTI